MKKKIDEALARRVLAVVDKGLINGTGHGPGDMCVEQAVTYAMEGPAQDGLEVSDRPTCVNPQLSGFKIGLNDNIQFRGDRNRARALRRIAIAQLGTRTGLKWPKFTKLLQAEKVRLMDELRRAEKSKLPAAKLVLFEAAMLAMKKDADDNLEESIRYYVGLQEEGEREFSEFTDFEEFVNGWSEAMVELGAFRKLVEAQSYAIEAAVIVLKRLKAPGTRYLHLTVEPKGPEL